MARNKEQLDVAEPFQGFWYLKCSTCELEILGNRKYYNHLRDICNGCLKYFEEL